MIDLEFDKLPPILQLMLTLGALIASTVAGVFGWRNRATTPDSVPAREGDDDRDKIEEERDKLALRVAVDQVRTDLTKVMEALRIAIENRIERGVDSTHKRFDELERRIREIELIQARAGHRK